MSSSLNQKRDCDQKQPTNLNIIGDNLSKKLAADSSMNVIRLLDEKVRNDQPSSRKISQHEQKLMEVMAKLKKDVTFMINSIERDEVTSDHCVLKNIDLLNTYVDQMMRTRDIVKRGGNAFIEILSARQTNIHEVLRKIRQELVKKFSNVGYETIYAMNKQRGSLPSIFTLLGIIERELLINYEKIGNRIAIKNSLGHKLKEPVSKTFTSSKSMPVLRTLKRRHKVNTINIENDGQKNLQMGNFDDSKSDNIPAGKHLVKENIKGWALKKLDSNTSFKNFELKTSSPTVSFVHDKKTDSENNSSELQESSQASMYVDSESNSKVHEIGSKEYKATGFEISISNENIQIKIPTNVIYLVENNEDKSTVKENKGQNLIESEIWVNNQKNDLLSSTSLDLSKRSDWWPAFGRNVGAPVGSVQPNTLVYKPTHDVKTLESRLEKILRNAIMKLRPTYRTIWNRYCSSSLKKLLPGLEKAAWSGEINSPPDHIQELQHILSSYKMSGFPINMPYNSPSELVDAVKSTGVYMNDAPEIEFSVAVYIHPFPNNVISVWVYVASLIRRR